jgi:hypothetical protein
MKRQQDMIPQKLQGEVQELAIEEFLKRQFPLDDIQEIKSGARGADCLQSVKDANGNIVGTIYYESKRAKTFQNVWIDKFNEDIRIKEADLGVLVTEILPTGMERFGSRDGVLICTYDDFKALSGLLRNQLLLLNSSKVPQINREAKVERLYSYLTSNQFRTQFEAIVECYEDMRLDLQTEKTYFNRMWRSREKKIEALALNAGEIYGSITGIAGNAVLSVSRLELPVLD